MCQAVIHAHANNLTVSLHTYHTERPTDPMAATACLVTSEVGRCVSPSRWHPTATAPEVTRITWKPLCFSVQIVSTRLQMLLRWSSLQSSVERDAEPTLRTMMLRPETEAAAAAAGIEREGLAAGAADAVPVAGAGRAAGVDTRMLVLAEAGAAAPPALVGWRCMGLRVGAAGDETAAGASVAAAVAVATTGDGAAAAVVAALASGCWAWSLRAVSWRSTSCCDASICAITSAWLGPDAAVVAATAPAGVCCWRSFCFPRPSRLGARTGGLEDASVGAVGDCVGACCACVCACAACCLLFCFLPRAVVCSTAGWVCSATTAAGPASGELAASCCCCCCCCLAAFLLWRGCLVDF